LINGIQNERRLRSRSKRKTYCKCRSDRRDEESPGMVGNYVIFPTKRN
jgi:hypothetical protein